MNNRYRVIAVFVCLALASCYAAAPSVAAETYVVPGAFGESFDALNESEQSEYRRYAQSALEQFKKQIDDSQLDEQTTYAQVLQTTLYLIPDEPPNTLTEMEQETWGAHYQGKKCVVSFIGIENMYGVGGKPLMDATPSQHDYSLDKDGQWGPFSLRQVRTRIFGSPVLQGIRVINMGSYCNAIYSPLSDRE